MGDDRYIEPTRSMRIKLGTSFALLVLGGWAFERALSPALARIAALPVCEAWPWVRIELAAVVALCWLVGAATLRYALRTWRLKQSPLPEAWVWSRTKVRTGFYAHWVVAQLLAVSVVAWVLPVWVVQSQKLYEVWIHPAPPCGC